jgi:hypothetical protein
MTIESAEGAINTAPSPWSALAVTNTSFDVDMPTKIEDIVRTRNPLTKILFCPKISESLPLSNSMFLKDIT